MNKQQSLKALKDRRKANAGRTKIDNSSLHAGAPMYFYCFSCDTEIVVPESYFSRPKLCTECQRLKELGWLE